MKFPPLGRANGAPVVRVVTLRSVDAPYLLTVSEVYADRKSVRLLGFDYSRPGEYFITICSARKRCIFGEVVDFEMVRNDLEEIVAEEWLRLPSTRSFLELDEWIVMPNHFHGILRLLCLEDETVRLESVGSIVGQFKSRVTKRAVALGYGAVWQRSFYERVIRDDRELDTLRDYIRNNPIVWGGRL